MKNAVALCAWLVASSSFGAMFPTPLHLVRRIDDPVARTSTTVDEYCYGDRIVSVNGSHVAITDYAEQRLTEIDHQRATYSITSFADIARARPAAPEPKTTVKVEVNRSIALSRDAVEALVGASYPNQHAAQHDQILSAAAPQGAGRIAAQSQSAYGLPSDTAVTYENGLTVRNVIVHVDYDVPPAQLMLIDPGATRVESRLTRTARELQQLDVLPKP
ncbi:MAG TPA: hypothetical protein VJ853_07230 [Thermoanaerobaculia bacterium]|nr:hypothetical protein [Thermoanaerobaculia bacterium]